MVVMGNDIKLFASLCISQGILNKESCQELGKNLTANTELLDFAQSILDHGLHDNFDEIQELLYQSEQRAAWGELAEFDPFRLETTPESTAPELKLSQSLTELTINTDGIAPAWLDPLQLEGISKEEARQAVIALLMAAAKYGASDLHISSNSRIFVRHHRAVVYKSEGVVSPEVARALNLAALSDEQITTFDAERDYDFAMPFSSGLRFRVNLMQQKDGISGTYRIVPTHAPGLEELGFKNAATIKDLLAFHNGLILVTGPVGSGKTTTLSALINILNQTREDHIITIEEPIEVIQQSKQCQITQRGVGHHTQTFKSALKGALRQDPDIIVIGEMRDLETIEMAVSASETGHLVIGTMHTSDASTTLNCLLDVFPPEQQPQIRSMVAESLRGVLCQRLLPTKNGGVALANELLLQNLAVSTLIREGKSQGLSNIMETGRQAGMVQMDYSVMELWETGRISDEIALLNLQNDMLRKQIRNRGSMKSSQQPAQ
jgi:twitching motility protein PilT